MSEFLFGLAEVTLSMSAVIALLLLGARAWGRRFAYRWRYLAWLVVAVRLAVPVNLPLPRAPVRVEVPTVVAARSAPAQPPIPVTAGMPQFRPTDAGVYGQAALDRPEAIRRPSAQTLLFAAWAAGAAVFLAVQFGGYAALRRSIRRWGREAGGYEGLRVIESPKAASPMLVGFFRPFLVLPEGMENTERNFALLHEVTHARRHDLWYKLLLVWCNALHWFNPLVWVLRRAAAGDVELACDEALLQGKDEAYRRAYGSALVARAAGRSRGAALTSAFSGSKGSLKARVVALLDMAPKRSGRMALAAVCILALLSGTLVACRPAGAEQITAVVYSFSGGAESVESPPDSLAFRFADVRDPVTGTVFYGRYLPDDRASELQTLPIAEDAVYHGFPTTLPNSDLEMHPGVVLRMVQLLSSQSLPVIPVELTVKDGEVTELAPVERSYLLSDGAEVFFLDGPADEAGLVRYENETYGFALDIPEATARRLGVISVPVAQGAAGYAGPAIGEVIFIDRRLMGAGAAMMVQNRLGYAATVLCTAPASYAEGNTVHTGYSFRLMPGRMDRAALERMAGVSGAVAAEIEADSAVLSGLTPESRVNVSG